MKYFYTNRVKSKNLYLFLRQFFSESPMLEATHIVIDDISSHNFEHKTKMFGKETISDIELIDKIANINPTPEWFCETLKGIKKQDSEHINSLFFLSIKRYPMIWYYLTTYCEDLPHSIKEMSNYVNISRKTAPDNQLFEECLEYARNQKIIE